MKMIEVSECVLKALLELLFRTNSCSVIKEEMRDVSGCDDDDYSCIKEHCPAALMNCMDLNYYLFHKNSCHDECCDCPLDSVESMIEWLKEEG